MRFLIALLLFFVLPAMAASETESKKTELRQIERAQKAKEQESQKLAAVSVKIQGEVAKLKVRLVEVSDRLAEHVNQLKLLEVELSRIQQQENILSAQRHANQKDLSQVLAVVLRLSRLPPEAIVFSPEPPQQVIDTTLGMQTVMSELNRRVVVARQQLGDLATVHEKLRLQQQAVVAEEEKISSDRLELSGLMRQREVARRQTDAQRATAEQEAKALASRALDLRELIQQLQRARKGKHTGHPAAPMALVAAGSARAPVPGDIIRTYGAVDAVGNHSRGIAMATTANALVVAPRSGQIVFAGLFRSYGQVVIIEIAEGQHILLTGLGNITVSENEAVRAGEPVGRMPEATSQLYLETRENGEPVDPATFGLAAGAKKI